MQKDIHVSDIKKLDFTPVAVVDRTTLDGKVVVGYPVHSGSPRPQ